MLISLVSGWITVGWNYTLEVLDIGWNIKQETGWKDSLIDLMWGLVKIEVKSWVRGLVRVCGRKPNLFLECFNLSQLPSPYEGLV